MTETQKIVKGLRNFKEMELKRAQSISDSDLKYMKTLYATAAYAAGDLADCIEDSDDMNWCWSFPIGVDGITAGNVSVQSPKLDRDKGEILITNDSYVQELYVTPKDAEVLYYLLGAAKELGWF